MPQAQLEAMLKTAFKAGVKHASARKQAGAMPSDPALATIQGGADGALAGGLIGAGVGGAGSVLQDLTSQRAISVRDALASALGVGALGVAVGGVGNGLYQGVSAAVAADDNSPEAILRRSFPSLSSASKSGAADKKADGPALNDQAAGAIGNASSNQSAAVGAGAAGLGTLLYQLLKKKEIDPATGQPKATNWGDVALNTAAGAAAGGIAGYGAKETGLNQWLAQQLATGGKVPGQEQAGSATGRRLAEAAGGAAAGASAVAGGSAAAKALSNHQLNSGQVNGAPVPKTNLGTGVGAAMKANLRPAGAAAVAGGVGVPLADFLISKMRGDAAPAK